MICKFCNAQIPDDSTFCSVCGMSLSDEPVQAEPVAQEAAELTPAEEAIELQETVQEQEPAENAEPVEEDTQEVTAAEAPEQEHLDFCSENLYEAPVVPAVPKRKIWPVVVAAIGAFVALCVLAVVLLVALGVEIKIPENTILRKEVYTVEDAEAGENAAVVVAKAGDAELTNAQLQIYYRMQVLDFVNYYSSYLSSVGFDYTKPLSEQTCYFDDTMTWEQYFIDVAIQTWESYQTMALEAESVGFALDEELAAELAKIPESLETQAAEGEYESADAMIKDLLGPACTVDDYMEYVRMNALSNEYYAVEHEKLKPSDEDVESYYGENEAAFTENGITKESGLVSSVRHILVCPKAEETTEESTAPTEATTAATEPTGEEETGFTDAQWAQCLAEAERILQEWKDGEATEESFAAMVATYTEDPGSASTGGLYENINPTSSYVENFLKWSVDMARQPGDTGIVQTEYGYHIMYFVSGEPYWLNSARTQLLSERTDEMLNGIKEKYPLKVNYNKIALAALELA